MQSPITPGIYVNGSSYDNIEKYIRIYIKCVIWNHKLMHYQTLQAAGDDSRGVKISIM
jgi:hypothetical protein